MPPAAAGRTAPTQAQLFPIVPNHGPKAALESPGTTAGAFREPSVLLTCSDRRPCNFHPADLRREACRSFAAGNHRDVDADGVCGPRQPGGGHPDWYILVLPLPFRLVRRFAWPAQSNLYRTLLDIVSGMQHLDSLGLYLLSYGSSLSFYQKALPESQSAP